MEPHVGRSWLIGYGIVRKREETRNTHLASTRQKERCIYRLLDKPPVRTMLFQYLLVSRNYNA